MASSWVLSPISASTTATSDMINAVYIAVAPLLPMGAVLKIGGN
jgi:hypothetical protein